MNAGHKRTSLNPKLSAGNVLLSPVAFSPLSSVQRASVPPPIERLQLTVCQLRVTARLIVLTPGSTMRLQVSDGRARR